VSKESIKRKEDLKSDLFWKNSVTIEKRENMDCRLELFPSLKLKLTPGPVATLRTAHLETKRSHEVGQARKRAEGEGERSAAPLLSEVEKGMPQVGLSTGVCADSPQIGVKTASSKKVKLVFQKVPRPDKFEKSRPGAGGIMFVTVSFLENSMAPCPFRVLRDDDFRHKNGLKDSRRRFSSLSSPFHIIIPFPTVLQMGI
jgi:hypothetical protein